jgi:predicted component of type VI protein secretion system
MNDTELQAVETRYEPSILLDRIASRMKSGLYKNNEALFNSDYEELEKAANGTMNDALSKILSDYYSTQQESTPSLLQQIGSGIASQIGPFLTGVVVAIIGMYLTRRFQSDNKQDNKKDKGKGT